MLTNLIKSFSPVVTIAAACVLIFCILVAGVVLRVMWENDALHFRSILTRRKRRRRRRAPSLGDINFPPK